MVISLIWWWPLITGYSFNMMLLRGHWLCSMLGFNFCFFPMHYLGLCGVPRRVSSYDPSFQVFNSVSRFGSALSAVSGCFLLYVVWESVASGNKVVSSWGSNSNILKSVVLPTPYHSTYFSYPVR